MIKFYNASCLLLFHFFALQISIFRINEVVNRLRIPLRTLLFVLILICQFSITNGFATTITVTNTNDNGIGSLRQAIIDAIAGDTINFAVTGTITLTTGEILVNKRLTIIGPGVALLAIDGNAITRVIHTTAVSKISGLTIRNGSSSFGSGVFSEDTLFLNHCNITGNYGAVGGGGIYTERPLTMKNCNITDNTAGLLGGAGLNCSTTFITIDSCAFIADSTQGNGGGIYGLSLYGFSMTNSTISACYSEEPVGNYDGGGGINLSSCLVSNITNCIITGNRSKNGNGGGICVNNFSQLNLINSTISGNRATYGGGIICSSEGNLNIINCNVFGNHGNAEGGGLCVHASNAIEMNHCNFYNNTSFRGAGIFIGGFTTIKNSAIYNNTASGFGGGILQQSGLVLSNSTISGNVSNQYGGGIYFAGNSNINQLTNNTIAENVATLEGDGIYGTSVVAFGQPVYLSNNIFSNVRNFSLGPNFSIPSSLGGNISSDATMNSFLTESSDINITNPLIGALVNNGGYTLTHALQCGSPAINGGLFSANTIYDQRGFPRIGNHDMGAYEINADLTDAPLITSNQNMATAIQVNTITNFGYCDSLMATVSSTGTSPISGSTTAKIWIDATQNSHVRRHYEITPDANASSATGRVTFYITQADFNEYNAIHTPDLPTNPTDNIGIGNLRVEKRGGSSSDNSGNPATYSGTLQIIDPNDNDIIWNAAASRWELSFDITGFSGFWVKANTTVLPLTLLSFNGGNSKSGNTLDWKTQHEINFKHFVLERSDNGVDFIELDYIVCKLGVQNNYQYQDNKAFGATFFYRLKIVDNDGTFKYSKIVTIDGDQFDEVLVFPNPSSNIINVILHTQNVSGPTAKLYNYSGQFLDNINLTRANNEIDISHLPQGFYFLKLANGRNLKIIKQ